VVQSGERDSVGIGKQTKGELERADGREMFEKSMVTAKDAGSATIGATQAAGQKTTDLTDRSRTGLRAAVSTVSFTADPQEMRLTDCRSFWRWRNEQEMTRNIVGRWTRSSLLRRSGSKRGNAAASVAHSTSLESFVDDPSLGDLHSALRKCVIDIRNDTNLQQWFDDYLAFARRALEHTGDNDPEEIMNSEDPSLRRRWNVLTGLNTRKWKEDYGVL
jgi:hypothetical protein